MWKKKLSFVNGTSQSMVGPRLTVELTCAFSEKKVARISNVQLFRFLLSVQFKGFRIEINSGVQTTHVVSTCISYVSNVSVSLIL